jgi:hypothetical protein
MKSGHFCEPSPGGPGVLKGHPLNNISEVVIKDELLASSLVMQTRGLLCECKPESVTIICSIIDLNACSVRFRNLVL